MANYTRRTDDLEISLDGTANDGAPGEGDTVEYSVEAVSSDSGDDLIRGFDTAFPPARGNGGDDTLIGSGVLDGGTGADHLIQSGSFGASLRGGSGDDLLEAENHASFEDGPGNDTSTGGPGRDYFYGQPGADVYDGAGGTDEVRYYEVESGVTVTFDGQPGDGRAGENDNVLNIENVLGSYYDDYIEGDEGANDISGVDGVDILLGGGGNDRLAGAAVGGQDIGPDHSGDRIEEGDGEDQLWGEYGATSSTAARGTICRGPVTATTSSSETVGTTRFGAGSNSRTQAATARTKRSSARSTPPNRTAKRSAEDPGQSVRALAAL